MQRYQKEAKLLVKLATPVLLASIAQTGMGFVDTVMAGGVSATDMAAVAVATSIWNPAILFGIGLLLALVPVIAYLNGASRQEKIAFEIQQGFYLACFISIPIILILTQTQYIMQVLEVEEALASKANGYLFAMVFAVPAFLFFQTLRSLADGLSLTTPAMILGFFGLLINIPLNWIFVYGKFGMPALGAVGCGVATVIVYWLMFLGMLAYVLKAKRLQKLEIFAKIYPPKLKELTRLFKLGFPVGAAIFFEVSLFAAVALLIAPLGSITVAAHQVALNFSSLIFMLPMSIGSATTIRVGHQLGESHVDGARVSSRVGILFGLSTAIVTAVLTIVFRPEIINLYTDNAEVANVAMTLLLMAGIYQCTDAIQVIAAGALRGYKDMTAILFATLISYWGVGMTLGYVFGHTSLLTPEPLGAMGYWIGLILGLTCAAVLLGLRLHWIHKQSDAFQLRFSNH